MTLTEFLKEIADAIREKKGTSDLINPQNFASEIASIEGGSGGGFEGAVGGIEYLEMYGNGYVIKAKVYGNFVPPYSFYKDVQLTSVELPDSITRIGERAFQECSKLNMTELPNNLTTVDLQIFYGCKKITEITFKSTPNFISTQAFTGSNLTTINVPWAEGEVKNAPWGATNATINYNYVG